MHRLVASAAPLTCVRVPGAAAPRTLAGVEVRPSGSGPSRAMPGTSRGSLDDVDREPLLGAGLGEVEAGRRRRGRTRSAMRSPCPAAARCVGSCVGPAQPAGPRQVEHQVQCRRRRGRGTCRAGDPGRPRAPASAVRRRVEGLEHAETTPSSTRVTTRPTARSREERRRAPRTSGSSGGVLLSHTLAGAVPSALKGLASGFGMGPGVSPSLWPP